MSATQLTKPLYVPATRYIALDSTFRDRNKWPNPGHFEIIQTGDRVGKTSLTAIDPVIESYPVHGAAADLTFAGGTAAIPLLDATASAVDNYYVGHFLEDRTLGEVRLITSYVGATKAATLASAFSGGWNAADTFFVRKKESIENGTLAAGTTTTVTLPAASSSVDDFYNGYYVWVRNIGVLNQVRLIIDYDGATRVATLDTPFPSAAGANYYEILQFSYDNDNPFDFPREANEPIKTIICEVKIVDLILPVTSLFTSNGGTINNYPYVYVDFGNATGRKNVNLLSANSPFAKNALFKVPVIDVSNVASNFIKIRGFDFVQTIQLRVDEAMEFGVRMPNGEYFTPATDNVFPVSPNPLLQISATFAIRRVDKPSQPTVYLGSDPASYRPTPSILNPIKETFHRFH